MSFVTLGFGKTANINFPFRNVYEKIKCASHVSIGDLKQSKHGASDLIQMKVNQTKANYLNIILHLKPIHLGGKLKPFKPIVTNAATWEPTNGFVHYDNIFPHIAQGFRNRTVPIAIYHVRNTHFVCVWKSTVRTNQWLLFLFRKKKKKIESTLANSHLQ